MREMSAHRGKGHHLKNNPPGFDAVSNLLSIQGRVFIEAMIDTVLKSRAELVVRVRVRVRVRV